VSRLRLQRGVAPGTRYAISGSKLALVTFCIESPTAEYHRHSTSAIRGMANRKCEQGEWARHNRGLSPNG